MSETLAQAMRREAARLNLKVLAREARRPLTMDEARELAKKAAELCGTTPRGEDTT